MKSKKNLCNYIFGILLLFAGQCQSEKVNTAPEIVSVTYEIVNIEPYIISVKTNVEDADNDLFNLFFKVDGEIEISGDEQTKISLDDLSKTYNITVTAKDSENNITKTTLKIDSPLVDVNVQTENTYQTIQGFGGYGSWRPLWFNFGTIENIVRDEFIDLMVNDLGLVVLRDEIIIQPSPEKNVFDPSRLNNNDNPQKIGWTLDGRIYLYKAYKEAIEKNGDDFKLILTVWTPPEWMKEHDGDPCKGTLKPEHYGDFADYLVTYVKYVEEQLGIKVFGISIQNEPTLTHVNNPTCSSPLTGEQYRDLLKTTVTKFRVAGMDNQFYGPETVKFLERIEKTLSVTMQDPEVAPMLQTIAVHSYAGDGIEPGSASAVEWKKMWDFAQQAGPKELWMTETTNPLDWNGAMIAAKRIMAALNYGNISMWCWWKLSDREPGTQNLLVDGKVTPETVKYYASKHFFRYIRPGYQRVNATSSYPSVGISVFRKPQTDKYTTVIINDTDQQRVIKIKGLTSSNNYNLITTTDGNYDVDRGKFEVVSGIILEPNSISTVFN